MTTGRQHTPPIYEIRVQSELDPDWRQWFNGLTVARAQAAGQPPTTTLTGPVADQAALRGLLGKLWDLNLTLIEVRRLSAAGGRDEQDG